jgi:hypothetical protein
MPSGKAVANVIGTAERLETYTADSAPSLRFANVFEFHCRLGAHVRRVPLKIG